MIKCFIIDDETHAIDTLVNYINKVPHLELAGYTSEPLTALRELKDAQRTDLVFLDIDMPELSGIELADLLPPKLFKVFITAFPNYALDAFGVNAADYLLKPISFARFLKSIDKVTGMIGFPVPIQTESPNDFIFINPGVRGKVLQLHVDDIIYVEGLKNYITIFTTGGGKYITYLTMNEMMAALTYTKFARVHKSYIVNLRKIRSVEGNMVKLAEHIILPLGASFKNEFMDIITSFTVKTNRK
ncbi:LytTR family DNA-binding domain-containing protein [Mucilaginibacter sp. CSA2-8R]|uniref:LytR/AlgR family response regulator transcription factor n=1 Tax=Mucilaginibacter sp. CSA2-8R TaxID=3141542 RepID=UPI00315D175F